MKDFYAILGLDEKASLVDIKKAYKKVALECHPDRGGNTEKMALVAEAYHTLSDSIKRRDYESRWRLFQQTNIEHDEKFEVSAYLDPADVPSYSQVFKDEHKELVAQYEHKPLTSGSVSENFSSFKTDIYSLKDSAAISQEQKERKGDSKGESGRDAAVKKFHDIFAFIAHKTASETSSPLSFPILKEAFSPTVAVNIFMGFLAGNYYGAGLTEIKKYLLSAIEKVRKITPQAPALLFYEGIFEIILLTDRKPSEQQNLLSSIKKITDYAKKLSDMESQEFMPLFYNKYFRNLYAQALHLYWQPSHDVFSQERLKQLDGKNEAKEFFEVLRGRLTNSKADENLNELIRYVKLLYWLEKDLDEAKTDKPTAAYYRDKAFHLLNWVPTITTNSNRKIVVNFFVQIGINFQRAALLETKPAVAMADERLALKMYLTSVGIGSHVTPDVELYAGTQVLKFLSAFHYQNPVLDEVIPAVQKRTLLVADVFPFFEDLQSNISFFTEAGKPIRLMRSLLNALFACLEYNKTHPKNKPIDHAAVNILYQVYEACLKNWYQEQYDPALEERIRLELMEELLFEKGWTFLDIEQNVDSPWIMVNRDEHGWMRPVRELPYIEDAKTEIYKAINGVEINKKTGEITFFLEPWNRACSPYEKLFTTFDVKEIVEKNLAAAIFSLDPVDPDKPYHPFNNMRYSPAQLAESELFNTMLLTDYTLKFLTTRQEVMGRYPYEQRPLDRMIEHLPEYLREIIHNFHQETPSREVHRFWIEAEGIDIAVSEEDAKSEHITRFGVGNLKMVVKKHKMQRDIHGELKDIGNEDEGWPIYVLTPQQLRELELKQRVINGHAMIFVYAQNKLLFWENSRILKEHVPNEFRETLIRLFKQPKDAAGKVTQNSQNMPLIYRVVKTMATQAGLPHRYSPEFIFAHQFTTHYDEFAQYLPEFGRLKELSKISTLIRLLNSSRKSNRLHVAAIKGLLGEFSEAKPSADEIEMYDEIYQDYRQHSEKVQQNITSNFDQWLSTASTYELTKKWNAELIKIKNQISDIPSAHMDSARQQVEELFAFLKSSSKSPVSSYDLGILVYLLFKGDIAPLSKALVAHEKNKVCDEIRKQLPAGVASERDVSDALDGSHQAIAYIAEQESNRQLRKVKQMKEVVEAGFVDIGLGKEEKNIGVGEGRCFWVPASVRHEVDRVDTRGLARYSFFVYGGVSIQPNINVVKGGGPLGGSPVGGGNFNRTDITRGFQSHHIISPTSQFTQSHRLLQAAGFNNLDARINRIYLPTNESLHATRSIHIGRHTNAAMRNVGDKMTDIHKRGEAEGWSQAQYNTALRGMLSELRQDLRAGNIALNSRCRPWAS